VQSKDGLLTIGEVATRSGVATSALRYYESVGLISSARSSGGQRRYPRTVLRRIAFVRVAQQVGLTLDEIATALDSLPERRTPTKADWERLSQPWRARIDSRIRELQVLRDELTSCIGCGCLSLRTCSLYNRGDELAERGSGPQRLLNAVREATTKDSTPR
jgi:MerR family redox-sensitive transcriptional activator SoxR